MIAHSSMSTLKVIEQRPITLKMWVITAACACGHIFTATGETYNITYRMLERLLAVHARA